MSDWFYRTVLGIRHFGPKVQNTFARHRIVRRRITIPRRADVLPQRHLHPGPMLPFETLREGEPRHKRHVSDQDKIDLEKTLLAQTFFQDLFCQVPPTMCRADPQCTDFHPTIVILDRPHGTVRDDFTAIHNTRGVPSVESFGK